MLEAATVFLAKAPTDESFAQLTQAISLEQLCHLLLEPSENHHSLIDIYCHAMKIDGFCESFFLRPLAVHEKDLVMDFVSAVAQSPRLDPDSVHSLLKQLLPGLCQLMSVMAIAASAGSAFAKVRKRLINECILSLFDSESTLLAQLASRSIESGASGKLILTHLDSRTLFDKKVDCVDARIDAWRKHTEDAAIDGAILNAATEWMLPLIAELELRLKGAKEEEGMKDVISVRAASTLIALSDHSPVLSERADKERWFATIFERLYFTDDLLLRLTAGEMVIQEFPASKMGLRYIHECKIDEKFSEALEDPETDMYTKIGMMRVLANISTLIPETKDRILNTSSLLKCVAKFLNCSRSEADYSVKRSSAISCIGAVASGFNRRGLEALTKHLPSWVDELSLSITNSSTETETMAALQALINLLTNQDTDSVPLEKLSNSGTLEEQITPGILGLLQSKPFPYVIEMCYRAITAFIKRGLLAPLAAFCVRSDLQELLFSPQFSDPPAVKHAKHEFVKEAVRNRTNWLDQNCPNSKFLEALKWYSEAGAFSQPPQYKTLQTALADEAEM